MKKLAIFAVLLLILLAACKQELPPRPPPPGGPAGVGRAFAGLAAGMPSWAAEAKNVAVTPPQAYYGDGVIVSVSNYDYVYSNGYFYNSKAKTWEKFALAGEQEQQWLKGQGIGSIAIDANKFATGDNYLVIYACSKTNGQWDCNGGRWMLMTFKVIGAATGTIPELGNVDKMVINAGITPFAVTATTAEKDNFADINVIRYDARYKEPQLGLVVLVHVFDFNTRQEVDKTIHDMFKDIVNNGWQDHKGQNVAVYLDEKDHRDAVWTSGKEIIFVETFEAAAANKEVIEAYLAKYPSDLKKIT